MATVVDAARKGISIVVGAATGGGANAGWFGDGRDGELNVEDGETLSLDVALDEGQIVKQYTSGYIGTGSLLTAANRCNGMVLLFSGDLTVKGTISMDKKAPLLNPMEEQCAAEVHVALCGGLKGGNAGKAGNGGRSSRGYDQAGVTASAVPGNGFAFGGGFGPGSEGLNETTGSGTAGSGEPRPPIGTTIPYPSATNQYTASEYGAGGSYGGARGGGGPGGSGGVYVNPTESSPKTTNGNNGDAIGGGAVFLFVNGKLTIDATGVITADGGNGANGVSISYTYDGSNYAHSGGGGGAGGGIIAIVHNGDYVNLGSVAANGGTGGAKGGFSATAGTDGIAGTVFITTLADLLNAA